jgi:hypothetical protein
MNSPAHLPWIKTPLVLSGRDGWGVFAAQADWFGGFVVHPFVIVAISEAMWLREQVSCSDLNKIVTIRIKLFKSEQICFPEVCCVYNVQICWEC